MFRIVKIGDNVVFCDIDPDAAFELNQIAQLKLYGNKVICEPLEDDQNNEEEER